jgi:hypothetical protein
MALGGIDRTSAADVRPPAINLAVDAHLAEHAFGQLALERHDITALIHDEAKRLAGRGQEGVWSSLALQCP